MHISYVFNESSFCSSAVEFLRNAAEGMYDAIIVDSSDPIGNLINHLLILLF